MHKGHKHWAWLVDALSAFCFCAGTANTRTTGLKWCLLYSVVLQHISGMQGERQASENHSSGGAGFISTWEMVAVSDNGADTRNTCEDSAVHVWPGLHVALSFSLSWKTNARRVIDFSEAGKLFVCFAILF